MAEASEQSLFRIALDNVRDQPASYTVLLALVVLCASGLVVLPSEHRVYALVITVLAIAAVLALLFFKPTEKGSDRSVSWVFSAPKTGKYNEDFYRFFSARIREARNDIYITGDGFECADEKGTQLAESFVREFRYAMEKGVSVVRLQTKERSSTTWARLLAELATAFPERFSLYVLPESGSFQMSSVCVIDPDDEQHSIVELMLSTERFFGDRAADLAGTALFIANNQGFARELRDRILTLKAAARALPNDAPLIVNALAGSKHYFAYGSNMSETQMMRRCPSACRVGVGVLRGYELTFNRLGSYRSGGVASVRPREGSRVYGLIWKIIATEVELLDKHEDPSAYRRETLSVHLMDGAEIPCEVYIAFPQGSFEPDQEYFRVLYSAAQQQGLPADYLAELQRFAADQDRDQ